VLEIIREDRDDDHRALLDELGAAGELDALIERLSAYLRQEPGDGADPRLLLLQERAILVLGEVLWRKKGTGWVPGEDGLRKLLDALTARETCRQAVRGALQDPELGLPGHDSGEDYLAFINQFMGAVNEREMRDFALARKELLARPGLTRPARLQMVAPESRHVARVPMRVGLSSANASDNWTFSKLRGGRVANFALDLAVAADQPPRPPITVSLEATSEPMLELLTISRLETSRPTRLLLTPSNAAELLALAAGEGSPIERAFRDVGDPLLLLKYALAFSGIVRYLDAPADYVADPARMLEDVRRFTGGRGLRLMVESEGPSRAGFASSSCVALGLLRVLYGASGQEALCEPETLSSMALLLENEVGLKSGKQDTDGPLYAGVKALDYRPTTGFLVSDVRPVALDEKALCEHLVLANSGIERPPATGLRRGLNMRHYSYLSHDPARFPAVMRSLEVHDAIVDALGACDWPRLGALFLEYLDLRETIDPGATASRFDAAAGCSVLRLPIEHLRADGLIHGGMYTGAMGGGCMMLVATPRGRERTSAGPRAATRLEQALADLRQWAAGEARPFSGLEVYRYAINPKGLEYERQALRA
jgi:galactokinase/mevalonate kinase-like predicted kinase